MKIELKYTIECRDGFKQTFETPQEAIDSMEKNYRELRKIAGENDFVNYFIDATNKYFLKGSIACSIDGCYQTYELKTIVKI